MTGSAVPPGEDLLAAPEASRVAGVVAEELARTGCGGVVLASPPGPGTQLLTAWLASVGPVRTPDAGWIADVAGALAAAGAPADQVEALAWRAVGEAQAAAGGLLPVGSTDKTSLLLDPAPLPARVLPLGDVWATRVAALTGHLSVPPVLRGRDRDTVRTVEEALASYLQEGRSPARAFGALGELGSAVHRALDAAEPRRRGLLVPKLEGWTVGADLAR